MEKVDFKKAGYRFNGQLVDEITFFGNGSFSVVLENEGEKVCHLFDDCGKEFLPKQNLFESGAVLSGGYYLLKKDVNEVYTLYNAEHKPVFERIDGFRLFSNDWYELRRGAYKRLFNAEHQRMAKGYGQCQVFNVGYCLDKAGDGEVWRLCLPNGHFSGTAVDVVTFLGDGNRLQERPNSSIIDVVSFDGNIVVEDVTPCVQRFPNGRFAVQFMSDDSRKMFQADGEPLSPRVVANVDFMSDGRFVSYQEPGHRIVGLYDRRGYKVMSDLWRLQQVGNYYLIETEAVKNRLVNDNQEVIGDGYFPLQTAEGFSLFERESGELVLFNRNGQVFASDSL